jgi:hypothetical protein
MGTYLKIIPGSPQNLTLSVYPYLTPVKTTDFTIVLGKFYRLILMLHSH